MHVLKHAEAVVGRLDADERAHALVPGVGQVADREGSAHQRELELEAQEDVQVIGDLVGLDADQRRLDQVGGAHELIERDVVQLHGERLPDLVQMPLPERPRAADHVLPEARLRLVEAERRDVAAERALDGARQALLVETVAGLVQDGEEAGEEVVLALARRQADVAGREACGERVRRLVQAPGLEVEPDRSGQAGADGTLGLRRVRAMHERVVGPRPRGDLLHERHQLVAQTVQQRLETCHAHVGLVLVEQRVIALAAFVANGVGLLAAQREEALQRLPELREIRLGARDLPGLETRRLGKRQLAHERGRDTYCSVALAPRLAHARAPRRRRGRHRRPARRSRPRSARRRCARAARPRASPWPRRGPKRRAAAC